MNPTVFGLWLLILYPFGVLIFDAYLKWGLHRSTISEYVWTHPKLKVAVCVYLALWSVILIAHLGFMFLPG